MHSDPVVFAVFVIFAGATLLAAAALFARQSLLIAYIALGVLAGPWVTGLVSDLETVESIGHIGIIFLLFLLGLNLHPQKLLRMLREAVVVTVISSLVFAAGGAAVALAFGFALMDAVLIGACMMFSSTIIGLKLLPTTALHHRHLGEIIISVLLLQDLLALALLLVVEGMGHEDIGVTEGISLALAPLFLGAAAYLVARHGLLWLMQRFDTIQEYLFLAAVGWCLAVAQAGNALGLSYEMGAFIAGVTLATSPVSTFIAESLKPLRDFFLIAFFFSLGAGFELPRLGEILLPALVLAIGALLLKPWVFRILLSREEERPAVAAEAGVRLGQISEFALLVSALALSRQVIGDAAAYLIQAAALLSFIGSSYWIVDRYPTPMAVNARLRRD